MKKIEEIEQILRDNKWELKKRYNVNQIGMFGSYVRGENQKKSDLDILVDFDDDAKIGLLRFINLENYLSDLLRIKVDLVMRSSLKPKIGKHILEEVVYL
ncbi:MAG: nucleotidyltransferase family protein [bacterium]